MKDKESRLKKCPFCGSNAKIYEHLASISNRRLFRVGCSNNDCLVKPITVGFTSDKETAIAEWNKRSEYEQRKSERD